MKDNEKALTKREQMDSIDRIQTAVNDLSNKEKLTIVDEVHLAVIAQDPSTYLQLKDLSTFNKLLDMEPSKNIVKKHPQFKKVSYIPIRDLETMLREIFGVFQVKNQTTVIAGNSVMTTLELHVYHPILNEWVVYAGTGAVPIELQAKRERNGVIEQEGAAHALDFEKMNRTAMQRNAPASAGFAFSNACKKIGRRFGSHLNDKDTELKILGIY